MVVAANWIGVRGVLALGLSAVLWMLGCQAPLPDAESPEARLYARECGICHAPYAPHLLKPAMWQMQMERMASLRRQRGLSPLTAREENIILDYLTRHAG